MCTSHSWVEYSVRPLARVILGGVHYTFVYNGHVFHNEDLGCTQVSNGILCLKSNIGCDKGMHVGIMGRFIG